MRVLITIPHYCRRTPGPDGFYGSERDTHAVRAQAVARCIAALHQTFGEDQSLVGRHDFTQANTAMRAHIEVVVVTSFDNHLVDTLPRNLFFHQPTQVNPRALGFVCHNLMRAAADKFDWFVFLEDDIEVTDALLFNKLAWFNAQFGPQALLQPNRFEVSTDLAVKKLYVDGDTTAPEIPARFQDISVNRNLAADALGRTIRFQRVDNAHSGCFFVSATQLAKLMESPNFGQANADFFGPLESAATLPLITNFEVYKPSRENAGFLEVRHTGVRFLVPSTSQDTLPIPPTALDPATGGQNDLVTAYPT